MWGGGTHFFFSCVTVKKTVEFAQGSSDRFSALVFPSPTVTEGANKVGTIVIFGRFFDRGFPKTPGMLFGIGDLDLS